MRKNVMKHFFRQAAGVRIITRAMIAVEDDYIPRLMRGTMGEFEAGLFDVERAQNGLMRD